MYLHPTSVFATQMNNVSKDVVSQNEASSDEKLMLQYAQGNEEAFKELYFRHKAPLYRYCIRQYRNTSMAEECYQEIWMKVIRARKRYQSKAKFSTFLYRIAQNHIIDVYRKEKKRDADCEYDENISNDDVSIVETWKSSSQQLLSSQQEMNQNKIDALRRAITNLPFEQKTTLLLKIDNGFSIEQIAEITESKKESVKSRIRYATAKLKHLLQSNSINENVLSVKRHNEDEVN